MNASDFHDLFRAAGEAALAPLGFRYRQRAWHLADDGSVFDEWRPAYERAVRERAAATSEGGTP